MRPDKRGMHRRNFIKTLMAAGLGSTVSGTACAQATASSAETLTRVPTRPFGKTGYNVAQLALGGMFDIANNQLMLQQCINWGVTYWDTADCYEGGRSEPGIGRFLGNKPEIRKAIFLVTKSDARDIPGMNKLLNRSLERMKTDYIDLYFIHGISDIKEITPEMKTWTEKTKKAGKIRLFGFSTHRNMEDCLLGAARLGWVDGAMFSYNYRIMHKDDMKRAVDACTDAGMGLCAMKTQGGGSVKMRGEKELKLAGRFVQQGFTEEQAKLKAVWQNPQIASICSQMPNMKILMANIAAALDKKKLAQADMDYLQQYAMDTCSGYCAGCGNLCSKAANELPISDVMRCLMYHHSYGDTNLARTEFRKLGLPSLQQLEDIDFTGAERVCPHGMAIASLMKEAARTLT